MRIDTKIVNIFFSDLGNGYKNGALLAGHLVGAAGVTIAALIGIDSLTKKLFNSKGSYLEPIIASVCGISASILLAPHSRFVKFSAAGVSYLPLFALFSAALFAGKRNAEQRKYLLASGTVALLGIAGMISGRFGHRSLIPFGFIGTAGSLLFLATIDDD